MTDFPVILFITWVSLSCALIVTLSVATFVGEDIKEIRAYPLPDLAQAAVGVAFTQVVEMVLVDISEDS